MTPVSTIEMVWVEDPRVTFQAGGASMSSPAVPPDCPEIVQRPLLIGRVVRVIGRPDGIRDAVGLGVLDVRIVLVGSQRRRRVPCARTTVTSNPGTCRTT